MDKNFWYKKWENSEIAFHESKVNPLLIRNLKSLPQDPDRIFVPLCGKTLDIAWLLNRGYKVVGVELVEMAIEQLFEGLNERPEISQVGDLKHYHAPNIDIFVGDIFRLSQAEIGSVDAVYDRAAFVALSDEIRTKYVAHVAEITNRAPQLLVTYEYDQAVMDGPPFSLTTDEVKQHYSNIYELSQLACEIVEGGLKEHPAKEYVWLVREIAVTNNE